MNYTIGVQNLAPLMDLQILWIENGSSRGRHWVQCVSFPKMDCSNAKKMTSKVNKSQ